MEKEEEREDGDSYRTLVVITVGEVVLEAQKMGSYGVLDVNNAFKIKNPKFKTGLKNMPKLVRSWIERWFLANSKTGVHNVGYSIYKIFNDRRYERRLLK